MANERDIGSWEHTFQDLENARRETLEFIIDLIYIVGAFAAAGVVMVALSKF